MSLESAITALASPLFANKFHWDVIPDAAPRDTIFCIAQQVGGIDDWYIDKADNKTHRHARIQFYVWGTTRAEVTDKVKELSDAIRAMPHPTHPYGAPVADYQADVKLYGARQDFGFWYPFDDSP